MKKPLLLLLVLAAGLAHGAEPAAVAPAGNEAKKPAVDSVVITTQSGFRAASSTGSAHPDRVRMRLHCEYELVGAGKGSLVLAVNDKGEMDFSTCDSATVTRGRGEIDLKAEVSMFSRDSLRCMVMLKKSGAGPAEPPLAVAYLTIDLKQLRSTKVIK